jgi:hypothetical protein
VIVTHARKASETFAIEEQYGNIIRLPEPSAKGTTLPAFRVPKSRAIKDASISKIKLAKYRNTTLLHSIGTLAARRMMAPRRGAGDGDPARIT